MNTLAPNTPSDDFLKELEASTRETLAIGALVAGTTGEFIQHSVRQENLDAQTYGLPQTHGFAEGVFNLVASLPADYRAVGLGLGAMAATMFVQAGRAARRKAKESTAVDGPMQQEADAIIDGPRSLKRVGELATASAIGVGALAVGEHASTWADLAASVGVISMAVGYFKAPEARRRLANIFQR